MSSCIEFCGTKRKNLRPEGKLQQMKPEIPVSHAAKEQEAQRQDTLNRLRYVEVRITDQQISPPPPGVDINIDM